MSDEKLREKYDRSIFGESHTRKDFENEDTYQYWSKKNPKSSVFTESYEEMNAKVAEKLRTYKDYDDFLRQFESHREKHEARSALLREDGWKELNDKFNPDYKHFRDVP